MRCKCASRGRVASAVLSSFPTCFIIVSERASGNVLRVIHVVVRIPRVRVFCLQCCFWMHVLRYPCSVRSFSVAKRPGLGLGGGHAARRRTGGGGGRRVLRQQQQQQQQQQQGQCQPSGSGRATTPENKAPRSTVLEKDKDKEKEKHKEKEKDKEKGGEAKGEALGQRKTELAAPAEEVVVAEGAKGKEGKLKEGKRKGKEKGKEKAGGLGQVAFNIEGAAGPQNSVPAKTTRFEHYKEITQFMNGMQVLVTSHVLCCACLQQCFQRRSPRYARDPRSGSLLPDMLFEDICTFFASFMFWSSNWRSMG